MLKHGIVKKKKWRMFYFYPQITILKRKVQFLLFYNWLDAYLLMVRYRPYSKEVSNLRRRHRASEEAPTVDQIPPILKAP